MRTVNLILLTAALAAICCRKNITANPCADIDPLTTSFRIEIPIKDTLIEADTVLQGSYVQFHAIGEYDSISWKIGNDQRVFSQKQFGLYFRGAEKIIDVQLIAYKKLAAACRYYGIDTVSKQFFVKPVDLYNDSTPIAHIYGEYEGAVIGREADSFAVQIGYYKSQDARHFYYTIKNINKGCPGYNDPYTTPTTGIGFNKGIVLDEYNNGVFSFGGQTNGYSSAYCNAPKGYGYLKGGDTLIVTYSVLKNDAGTSRINETFTGIRKR